MVAEKRGEQRNYQRALRVVGRALDREPAYNLTITQTEGGFAVHARTAPQRPEERVLHFEWDRLDDLNEYYSAARGMTRPPRRTQDLWDGFPCGHEAGLRKLGAILDTEGASKIRVQETEGAITVTFVPPGGTPSETRERTFRSKDLCG